MKRPQKLSRRMTWGVMMYSTHLGERDYRGPLFDSWFSAAVAVPQYLGEPSRLLAFKTRDHARAFCDAKNAETRELKWHFFPVRIRETIKVIS